MKRYRNQTNLYHGHSEFSYSGTWPSYLTDAISYSLVGEGEARIIVKNSELILIRGPAMIGI